MAKSAFASFHYQRDHWRVQQVLNMGAIAGQEIVSAQRWEEVKRQGDQAVRNWIDKEMRGKSVVVVLIGAETASRRWVRYEIAKAWDEKRPLLGIQIHALKNNAGYTDARGANPFKSVNLQGGGTVGDFVPVFTPVGINSQQVYDNIRTNMPSWMSQAYKRG